MSIELTLRRSLVRAMTVAMGLQSAVSVGCGTRQASTYSQSTSCADDRYAFGVTADAGSSASDAGVLLIDHQTFCNEVCASGHTARPECCPPHFDCDAGGAVVWCSGSYFCNASGRRPAGLSGTQVGIGGAAVLEEASIRAFVQLRHDLHRHKAPRSLLRACSRARRDERRHVRAMTALARSYGESVDSLPLQPVPLRNLEEIAIENVVEGCVREAYGAACALWQARFAEDREVRAVLTRIAGDEFRHAVLAFKVARWIDRRLDPQARHRVAVARCEAVRELMKQLSLHGERAIVGAMGLPSPNQAQGLLTALMGALDPQTARPYEHAARGAEQGDLRAGSV